MSTLIWALSWPFAIALAIASKLLPLPEAITPSFTGEVVGKESTLCWEEMLGEIKLGLESGEVILAVISGNAITPS
ncbi:hypothetical protein BJP37_26715 [Moorena bouillonii PNG]|uniref:Uncharacterized protein n=1 Tax=Moorena bouillonii PNG TaxID=568701 RepID=A0A0H4TJZ1_9CYAN|nr:hypothetical protein [Moorena bouillonii PNG]OLT62078.1 hypothetical protein BJP37_26715 [Moorena bouillonii PNG]